MKNANRIARMTGCLVMAFCLNTSWAATAGYAQFVHGSVFVTSSDGQARKLIKGGAVSEGDTVSTARNASAQIRTQDGGFIAVRPDTQLKFDSFKYTGKAGAPERSYFSLFKGGFRAVTGLIGRVRKNDYRITTPAATIGIRGTDHETIFLAQAIPGALAGAYSKVNIGETSLTTNKGTINVLPNQMGFAGGLNQLPQLQPINTNIFTVTVAPHAAKLGKEDESDSKAQGGEQQQANGTGAQEPAADQPEQKTAEAGSADAGTVPVPPIRETATVDSQQEALQVSVSVAPAPTKLADAAATVAPPPPPTVPVTATSGGLTLDTTAQTVTAGGTTVSVSDGVYAAQAKAAADEAALVAQAATAAANSAASNNTSLLAIGAVNTSTATSAISTASSAITSNTPAVSAAAALTPADATAAAANASTAQTATTAAAAVAAAADTAFNANGTFADTTAATANTAVQSAISALSAANTTVQNSATTVVNQNAAMATAQTAASTAMALANTSLSASNTALNSATAQNTAITQAQSNASTLLSTAQAAAAAANTAATAAQAAATQAATLQAAGDLTGAAAQMAIAQQQLTIAHTQKANALAAQTALANQLAAAQSAKTLATTAASGAVSAANAAATAAATALTQANAANTAASTAASALTTTATQLAVLNSNASAIATNAPIAAYNNPAVVSSNFTGHLSLPVPVAGGFDIASEDTTALKANTTYVLDGNGNLVEMRSTSFNIMPVQSTPTTSIANADVKWSGGTAADTFKLADNSIYGGRWMNSTVTVTDLSNSAVTTYTPAGSLWAVLLTPNVGYVQSLIGTTTYTQAAATAPFDTAGNVGTLISATLVADFTSQLVNAALNLTMPVASSMAGTYDITANGMQINTVASGAGYGGFGGSATPVVVNCTGGTCAAGAGGYSASVGGSFAGTGAASAGLGYDLWPTVAAGFPVTDLVQGLVAFNVGTAPSGPQNPTSGTWSSFGHMLLGSTATGWGRGRFNDGGLFALPETNFIMDGAGNLVRSLHVDYSERFVSGTSPSVNHYTDAMVTYSGGVASDRYITPDNNLIIGRWTGGQMTIADNLISLPTTVNDLGVTSSYWFMIRAEPWEYVQTLIGTTSYTQVGATLPTDSLGHVGTMPLASLSANFTAQTVNASVAFTIDNKSMTIANSAIPIIVGTSMFEGTIEFGTAPTVDCANVVAGACNVAGYDGWLTGGMAGAQATSAYFAYKAWPTAPADSLVADLIQGVVAFSGAAPTVGANPPAGTWVSFSHLPVGTSGAWKRGRFTEGANPPQSEASFILDGAGNLVRSLHVGYNERAVWNGGTSTTNAYGDAMVSYSGGVASDRYTTPDGSLIIGRWKGGQLTVTDNLGIQPDLVKNLGGTSAYWGITSPSPVNYVPSLTGTTVYTQGGATLPTDSFGNEGTTPVASLSANFTNQTIDASVEFTIANQTLTIANPAIPIVAGANYFDAMLELGTQPTVICTGTCSGGGYQGFMSGMFAGAQATSVDLSYKAWPTTTPDALVADIIQGVVAFYTATPPTPAPAQAYVANHIAVETAGGMNFNSGMLVNPADLVYVAGGTSTSGALQSMTFRDIGGGSNWMQTSSIIGGTATSANAASYASTGIEYGAWTGYTEQSGSWSTSLGGTNGNAPSAWMYGPTGYVDAVYMSGPSIIGAMAGTFTYQLDGATAPTSDQSGLTGVMNSATVTADFVTMLVSASLDLTMPGDENWGASITNSPIALGMGALNVSPVVTYSVGAGAPLAACATCSGNMSANFTGQNLAGIIASYELYNNANTGSSDVFGTVALTRNFAGNTNPPVTDDLMSAPTGNIEVATAGQNYNSVQSYPLASSTTTGNLLTAFGSSGAGFSNMTTVTCTTCTTTPTGQVATSGIYYGTWVAGTYDQSYSSTFTAGSMPPSYWITGPEAGPLYLAQALTGTASYTFDSGQVSNGLGVAGTVAGTTTLTLDFSKQAVGINLDFSLADTATPTPVVHNWNVSTAPGNEAALVGSTGISSTAFKASSQNNGGGGEGLLTVSVDGGATPVTVSSANVYGQLTGSGLNGAIMSFELNGVLNPATTPTFENIGGVAAFTGTAQNTATSHRYVAASFYDPFTVVPQPMMGLYANNPARVTQDVAGLAGNLTQFDTQILTGNGGASMTFASNTSTLIDQGSDAVTGISWGRWAGGTFNATDRITGGVIPVAQLGSLHWIAESAATSATTLPLVGSYTYVNAGGTTPTDNLGNPGTLNLATLTADFTAHTVNLGVNVTVNGATLDAVGANVPIIQRTAFYASSQEPAASTSHLNVTCTGTCGATLGGTVIGKFSGAGATGAAMTYGLQNGNSVVSGVTAFHR